MSTKTAVAYVRISRDPSDLRTGVERQREDVEGLAESLDAALGTIFEDNDVSAWKKRKPVTGWGRALVAIERDKPDYLLVFKIDRLGRRLSDIEGLEELCRSTGTKVISKVEGDVFANSAWPILVAVAKMESMNASLRIRRSQDTRRENGRDVAGGTRPFGYAPDRVTVVESESATIREMYHRVIDGGSIRSIVTFLNDREVPTVRGGKWDTKNAGNILRNPRYCGMQVRKGQVIGKGSWQRIITEETFNKAQSAMSANDKEQGPKRTTLLGGLLRCGECGERCDSNGVGQYRCANGAHVSRAMSILDPYVTTKALEAYSEDIVREDIRRASEKESALGTELSELDHEIEITTAAWKAGEVPETKTFLQGLAGLRRRRDRLVNSYFDVRVALDKALSAGLPREHWEDWTIAERRHWLAQRIDHVLVYPAGRGVKALDPKTVKIIAKGGEGDRFVWSSEDIVGIK